MKAMRSARCMLLAWLATALMTGCGWHSRSWQAQQEKERANSSADSPKGDKGATVMQQGTPVDEKRDADAEKRAHKAAEREEAERAKAEREEKREREKSERSREDGATLRGSAELRERRLTQLDERQIDDLLGGAKSDGHMLGMILMANDVDLGFARLAYARSENADVQAFAKRMITDHTQMIATLKTLIEDRNIIPADNKLARDLRDRASLQRDALLSLEGRAFDTAYVAAELEYHRELLALVDDVILPRVGDGDLRDMTTSIRPVISAHLAHAEQLQAAIAKR